MFKRLNFSNKTWFIIAGVILVLIIVIAIFKPRTKNGDLSLTSYDGMVTMTIEEVVRDEVDSEGRHMARCKVDRSVDFYRTFVKRNKYFIGSIDSNGFFRDAEDNRDTGYYIMLKDDHYFCLVSENGYATITELQAIINIEGVDYYMPFPCDTRFERDGNNEVDFISLTTVNSFEGLVSYYERLRDDFYLVDEINKTITVKPVYGGDLTENVMVISMTESGVLVTAESPY